MSSTTARTSNTDWPSLLQFIFSGLGLTFLWGLASVLLKGSFFDTGFQPGEVFARTWFSSIGFFSLGLLLLPSTILSLRRILNLPSRDIHIPGGRFALSVFLIPVALGAGTWLASREFSAWIVPFHLFVAIFSVVWILWIAIHNLKPGSAQRAWGALGTGLALTPLLAFFFEIIGAIFFFLILGLYVSINPELMRSLESITTMVDPLNANLELIAEKLQPLFSDPFVLFMAILGLGVFVPLVEELFKPLGVMLLLKRPLSAAQGFALGAICGAGYALVENLTVAANAQTWALTSTGRFGTSAMHILTAALSGYALVRAKNEKRYLALAGAYLLNVLIHGVWNTLVVLSSSVALNSLAKDPVSPVLIIGPALLVGMALMCLVLLHRYNQRLSAQSSTA